MTKRFQGRLFIPVSAMAFVSGLILYGLGTFTLHGTESILEFTCMTLYLLPFVALSSVNVGRVMICIWNIIEDHSDIHIPGAFSLYACFLVSILVSLYPRLSEGWLR